ncbi:MAG TPA: TetR/AcrR family transcriptional regulator [Acidimicrobiia bacterium]|nr:TetR/AcrR family transcriptional regulator [Acidimicrobiia bacterium]
MNGPEPLETPELEAGAPGDPARVDGRAARSAKTRDAIADALLDLLGDGRLRPTAKEIAERAGVSVRSVYVHFDDLEDLFCVAATRHFGRIAPMLTPIPAGGTVDQRAHALVSQRIRLYSQTGAVGRATRLHAESSRTLARILRDAHSRSCADLERIFAQELEPLTESDRLRVVAVLDVLTGPDAWESLRRRDDLSDEASMQCLVDAVILQVREAST